MGRLYTELAAAEGNKNDYIAKAIRHYQEALRLDPSASIVFEELTDLYIQTGRLQDAVRQAEDMLKQDPDNLDARRMLGRIYTRALGDNQSGRIDESNLKKAIDQYQKITQKDPKDADSWVMLGRLYRVANNSPEAEKAFNKALEADPENEDGLTQLAGLYADLGDSKRAIEKLESATKKTPNERTLAALADQYEQMHDYKNAAEALKKAMELAPDNDRIARGLAQDLMYSDQLDEALELYGKLAADDPKDPQLPLNMSQIYREKHELAKARAALDKAKSLAGDSLEIRYQEIKQLEAEDKNAEALTGLKSLIDETARKNYSDAELRRREALLEEYGIVSVRAEKYAQAVETFRQMGTMADGAKDTETAERAAAHVIDTYRQSKDYDSAIHEADAALKKYPKERMIIFERATVLADQGKIDAAAADIKSLLGNGDKDKEIYMELAQLYERGKRYPEMGKALDDAEKLNPSDEDKQNIYFMRGAMYERQKKYDASEAEFRKVLDLNPDHASALNYLGYMLADRNVRLDEAYKFVKKALDSAPDNGAYLDSMGWVCYRQGKLTEAESLLQRAIEKEGQDATVHDHLGDVYAKLGKTKEAIAQWQASIKAYQAGGSQSDADPDEMAKVNHKLDEARVRLAQETHKK